MCLCLPSKTVAAQLFTAEKVGFTYILPVIVNKWANVVESCAPQEIQDKLPLLFTLQITTT
eukprot:c34894_g1_i1 orf=3-182(-)